MLWCVIRNHSTRLLSTIAQTAVARNHSMGPLSIIRRPVRKQPLLGTTRRVRYQQVYARHATVVARNHSTCSLSAFSLLIRKQTMFGTICPARYQQSNFRYSTHAAGITCPARYQQSNCFKQRYPERLVFERPLDGELSTTSHLSGSLARHFANVFVHPLDHSLSILVELTLGYNVPVASC